MDSLQEMKQASVFEILKEHRLVVPEIQREYVWGRNDYDILDTFLEDILNNFRNKESSSEPDEKLSQLFEKASVEEREALKALIKKTRSSETTNNNMNIGFLYSYKPSYYISDEGKDAYLIDGQQRFTTIFLVLFYLAIKEDRIEDFRKLYKVDEANSKIAFDYRVRALTHNFIIDLIVNTKSIEDLLEIKEKRWFLSNYKKDTTIVSIVGNENSPGAFSIIHKNLENFQDNLFDFVRDNIKFWHFKTEETSQGEELYITMNSRGQQLADNETIRANLFKSDEAREYPLEWSQLWEEWQDLFWKNRAKDATSADHGFNEFLSCISGYENYSQKIGKVYLKEKFERYNLISTKDVLKNLSLPLIKKYISILKMLVNETYEFTSNYNYSGWVVKCTRLVWNILNTESTNWFANVKDRNRATEQNRMVLFWPLLHYVKKTEAVDKEEFFRLLRFYYVRYSNYDRSVSTIKKNVKSIIKNGFIPNEYFTEEENLKYNFLDGIEDESEKRKYEEVIWEIEDHRLNLNGRDVGATNISYLVDFDSIESPDDMELVRDKFYQIFPPKEKEYLTIQNILLYYGEYWHRITPYYYFNYQFNNWRRIIRERDHENKPTRNVFKKFFEEFLVYEGSISEFLEEKRSVLIKKEDCTKLHQKLCWYNQYIDNAMWTQGNFIAISNDYDWNALPDCDSKDKIFKDIYVIYNTKGNLRGGKPRELYKMLPKEIKKEL